MPDQEIVVQVVASTHQKAIDNAIARMREIITEKYIDITTDEAKLPLTTNWRLETLVGQSIPEAKHGELIWTARFQFRKGRREE